MDDMDRADAAIEAYDWEPAATWKPSPTRHAIMERYSPGAMRTLCGHVLGIGTVVDDRAIWARCGTCLNVIYAKTRHTRNRVVSKVLRIISTATGHSVHDGRYVTEADVDAWDGRGMVYTIQNADEARKFESVTEALEYWKRQSTVTPLRDDGRPNRPLTAYTVEVVDA